MNRKLFLTVFLLGSIVFSGSILYGEAKSSDDLIVAPPPPPLSSFDLPSFSGTTADADPHFVKITLALGYEESPELKEELISLKSQIQHIVNILIRGKNYEDIISIGGKLDFAMEIKAHINVILLSGKIKEVYFKEFIVN